jgi:hypothetical protein
MNFVLRFLTDQPWAIPVIGLVVASFAFLVGRRWIVPRPPPKVQTPIDPSLNMLATANLKPLQPDRRSAPRRKEGNRIEVYLTDETRAEPLYGWVIDRSLGGLCLNVEKPLNEGTILNVRPRKAPKTAPWIAVEIRSCRPDGSEWEVGCRFLKQPQWNDLLLFG